MIYSFSILIFSIPCVSKYLICLAHSSDFFKERKEKLSKMKPETENQISLFEVQDDKLRGEIDEIEIDKLTPLDALNKLSELKKKAKKTD